MPQMTAKKGGEVTDEARTPHTPEGEKPKAWPQVHGASKTKETASSRQQKQGAREADNKEEAATQDWGPLRGRTQAAVRKIREAYGPRTEDPRQWRWFLLGVTHTWKRIARVAKSSLPLGHKDEETNTLVLWEGEETPMQARAMAASIVTLLEKSIMRAIHRAQAEEEDEAETRAQRKRDQKEQREEGERMEKKEMRDQEAEPPRPRSRNEKDRLEELVAETESTAEYLRSEEFDEDIEAENQAQLALDGIGKVGTRTWHEWKRSGAGTADCRVATWCLSP